VAVSDSKTLITAIVPTYRRPRLLRRAIESVLAQTYPHFQVCVYDNASGDETAAVVRTLAKADPRIKYHCHPENIGGLKNFVYGMERVDTPFFSILSDDDVLLPKFYETAMEGFAKYPEALFSSLAGIIMNEKGTVLEIPVLGWRPGLYNPPEGLLATLKHGYPVWTAILFRREVLEKVGGLDEEVGPESDSDLHLRVSARFPIVISREPGAVVVLHTNSVGWSWHLGKIWPGRLKMVRNLTEDERIPSHVRAYAGQVMTKVLISDLFIRNGFVNLLRGNWDEAFKAAMVLRTHFKLRVRSSLLHMSAWACQHFPSIRYVFLGLRALRRFGVRITKKNRRLQREYGGYARFLEVRD
jgi:glycosyltransferase involved in cell wall biosynthesis